VIGTGTAFELPQQPRNIKSPAHDPKRNTSSTWKGLLAQQICQKGTTVLSLAIRDDFNRAQSRQNPGGLKLNEEPPAAKATGCSGN